MKVILTDNVAKVGKKYDVKNVADGFGRNFLIPRGLARLATATEMTRIESEKVKHEEKIKKLHQDLLAKIEKAKKTKISIIAKANEEGHLYAGLNAEAISAELKKEQGIEIEADWIVLAKPIKEVGVHTVLIKKDPFTDDKKLAEETVEIEVEVKAE